MQADLLCRSIDEIFTKQLNLDKKVAARAKELLRKSVLIAPNLMKLEVRK